MTSKVIDREILDTLARNAGQSSRRRLNHNFHTTPDDAVQRLCIAAEPGSYFRPNRHRDPDTWELLVALRGSFALLVYTEEGRVLERHTLSHDAVSAIELPPLVWHNLAAIEPGSVFLEVKLGPYHPIEEKDFADWAPPEGHAASVRFVEWFQSAGTGALPPTW